MHEDANRILRWRWGLMYLYIFGGIAMVLLDAFGPK